MRDVLIVGAGIGGLTLASLLEHSDLDVEIVDARSTYSGTGAGIALHPNALRALGPLGDRVIAEGVAIERQVVVRASGDPVTIEWSDVWGDLGVPLGISRRKLCEALTPSAGAVDLGWGVEVCG